MSRHGPEARIGAGVEGVILGCAEVEMLIRPKDVEVAVFASTTQDATAAVDAALADGSGLPSICVENEGSGCRRRGSGEQEGMRSIHRGTMTP